MAERESSTSSGTVRAAVRIAGILLLASGAQKIYSMSTIATATGSLECGIGLLLLLDFRRCASAKIALAMTAATIALAGFHYGDTMFLARSPYLIRVLPVVAAKYLPVGIPGPVLVLNCLIAVLLSHGLGTRSPWFRSSSWCLLSLIATVFGLSRENDTNRSVAAGLRREFSSKVGWRLPDCEFRMLDGTEASLRSLIQPGDGIMVFSTSCGYCQGAASDWKELANSLEAADAKLVLVALASKDHDVREFLMEHELEGLTVTSVANVTEWRAMGLTEVPRYLIVGPEHIVSWQTGAFRPAVAYRAACELVGWKPVVDGILRRLPQGPDLRAIGEPRNRGNSMVVRVVDPSQRIESRLVVSATPTAMPDRIEIAMLMQNDMILSATPIVWNTGLTNRCDAPTILRRLEAKSIDDAIAYATKSWRVGGTDARIWHGLTSLLYTSKHALSGKYD